MIHHLRNPQVLQHPALLPWLGRVCERTGYHVSASAYIAELCAQPYAQVLLGIEEERPVALLVTQLTLQPTLLLGYNEGSKEIGAEMMREAARWVRAAGFSEVLCTNTSGRSDAAYERGLRPHGKVIKRATTLLVELKEEQDDEVRSDRGADC